MMDPQPDWNDPAPEGKEFCFICGCWNYLSHPCGDIHGVQFTNRLLARISDQLEEIKILLKGGAAK